MEALWPEGSHYESNSAFPLTLLVVRGQLGYSTYIAPGSLFAALPMIIRRPMYNFVTPTVTERT